MSKIDFSTARPHAEPEPSRGLRKSDRTKAQILDAALEFLWSNPFRDLTVVSLMASTPLARSTFYHYFEDVYEMMEDLLVGLEQEILRGAVPWLEGRGDRRELLQEALANMVQAGHGGGPLLRAVADAAPADPHLDRLWNEFLERFDDVVTVRIETDQALGLIPEFEARPVAVCLNRMDAWTLIHAFGRRPRARPEPVLEAITRIWVQTLYGTHPEGLE
jgi:AcrR family transcriptional regulator